MPTLTVTRGLPGSGKTTWARERLRTDLLRGARVNRDDMRRSLHGGLIGAGWAERQVTLAQHAAVAELLRASVDVICDDTNLRARIVRSFAELARDCGADFAVRDFTDVPPEVCIERDAGRPEAERVGAEVITAMWQRYLAGKTVPLPLPQLAETPLPGVPRVYHAGRGLPEAVLVDIDGTVALMGDRSPYDMTRVDEDRPNHTVITAVRAMHAFGHHIVFCSGRSDDSRDLTEAWLAEHVGVPYEALFMRATGDTRKDSIVKAEIFEREIRHRWAVTGVFDDRNQVVRMWRSLGLTVFQVADGNF
jgi:predicted kinase